MPKKKSEESAEEQAKRFRADVQKLIDAGELDPIEADERFEKAMEKIIRERQAR